MKIGDAINAADGDTSRVRHKNWEYHLHIGHPELCAVYPSELASDGWEVAEPEVPDTVDYDLSWVGVGILESPQMGRAWCLPFVRDEEGRRLVGWVMPDGQVRDVHVRGLTQDIDETWKARFSK